MILGERRNLTQAIGYAIILSSAQFAPYAPTRT